jgi:S-(hydroxymethyl)glutathione dehydrogenase/alcohol dehydrogenase
MIIAVDTVESKLATAKELGATHIIDASSHDPVKAIQDLTGGGVEYAFEAIGLKKAAEQAYESLARGGTATVIGMIPVGQKVEIDGASLLGESASRAVRWAPTASVRTCRATSTSICKAASSSTR